MDMDHPGGGQRVEVQHGVVDVDRGLEVAVAVQLDELRQTRHAHAAQPSEPAHLGVRLRVARHHQDRMSPIEQLEHGEPLAELVEPAGVVREVHDHLSRHGLARDPPSGGRNLGAHGTPLQHVLGCDQFPSRQPVSLQDNQFPFRIPFRQHSDAGDSPGCRRGQDAVSVRMPVPRQGTERRQKERPGHPQLWRESPGHKMCAANDLNPGPAKEIARALRVPPAKIAPLVRLIAAQNAELPRRPDVVECWVSPEWHEGLTFEPHRLAGQSQHPDGHGRAGHCDSRAPRPALPKPRVRVSGRRVLS